MKHENEKKLKFLNVTTEKNSVSSKRLELGKKFECH